MFAINNAEGIHPVSDFILLRHKIAHTWMWEKQPQTVLCIAKEQLNGEENL